MATTTNYSWTTPDDTDLVKDGASAIRTLGSSIDTSFVDLKGGTTGQLLSKASSTDLDFTWASPSSFDNYQIINTGGTSLTGASTITISGISAKNSLMVVFTGASSASASSSIRLLVNSETTNYINSRIFADYTTSYNVENYSASTQTNGIELGQMSNAAGSFVWGSCLIHGANSAGVKPFQGWGGGTTYSGTSFQFSWSGGVWNDTDVITSISLVSGSGNFDAGTLYVYGA